MRSQYLTALYLSISVQIVCAWNAQTCQMCNLVAHEADVQFVVGTTDVAAMQQNLARYCNNFASSDYTTCIAIVDCQINKVFGDAKASVTPEQTCIDIGYCPDTLNSNPLQIVDWLNTTTDYAVGCVPVSIIVLHHTVTASAQETLDVLQLRGLSVQYIIEKNGTIYQMVHDYDRAWHAGAPTYWRDWSAINGFSVGVEIVNSGDEPFPDDQVKAVAALSRILIDRWHIQATDIVSHADIIPSEKQDVSGYFNWSLYYDQLALFPGLFVSALTVEEQHRVLQQAFDYDSNAVRRFQQGLSDYGYRGNIDVNGEYDTKTRLIVETFNRHFCPEIFVQETIDHVTDQTIRNAMNTRWYGISEERLEYLLRATNT